MSRGGIGRSLLFAREAAEATLSDFRTRTGDDATVECDDPAGVPVQPNGAADGAADGRAGEELSELDFAAIFLAADLALFLNDSVKYWLVRATALATARSFAASLGAGGVGGARRDSSVFAIV